MEKINIAKLLEDCPQGMELNCTIYNGKVCFEGIEDNNPLYPIKISINLVNIEHLDIWGQYNTSDYAKCIIFPKGKTTWEGFHKPFEDGDIIYTKHKLGTEFVSIFRVEYERDICTYWSMNLSTNKLIGSLHEGNAFKVFIEKDKIKEQRIATEEEKAKLFQAFIDNGYKWNTKSKTLEKLPKFKVGDRVIRTATHEIYIIDHITSSGYVFKNEGGIGFIFEDECLYELAPNKFDINTLVPFESRVLVRYNEESKWCPAVWGFYDYEKGLSHRYAVVGGISFAYCIPYEGNEHLRGKAEDCDSFYKTW